MPNEEPAKYEIQKLTESLDAAEGLRMLDFLSKDSDHCFTKSRFAIPPLTPLLRIPDSIPHLRSALANPVADFSPSQPGELLGIRERFTKHQSRDLIGSVGPPLEVPGTVKSMERNNLSPGIELAIRERLTYDRGIEDEQGVSYVWNDVSV
ncbi:hypothetical protein TNCV_4820861 [Trichonephila clavipes]|nr:hypothetical protein TNCV_4820861 [Trichonephila clavipes]